MNRCAAAAVGVVAGAVLVGCSSDGGTETSAATSSTPAVCASAADLRTSLTGLKDVDVAHQGTGALNQAWTTVQGDWTQFADDARAQHAGQVDGVQADVDAVQAALDSARTAPSAETLGAVASQVGIFLKDAGAVVDQVGSTC
jgi:hypothetical protein